MRSVGGLASARLVAAHGVPPKARAGKDPPGPFQHPRAAVVLPKSYDVDELLAVVRNFCG